MIYYLLADLVVGVHLAYVAYVVIGLLLILLGILFRWSWIRNPWFRFSHLFMIGVVAAEAVFAMQCPLTTWENHLWRLAEQSDKEEEIAEEAVGERSFVGRILNGVLFFFDAVDVDVDHPGFQWVYIGFGALVLLPFIFWPPRPWRWKYMPE